MAGMSKKAKIFIIIAVVLVSATAGYASSVFITYNKGNAVKEDAVVYIPTGATFEQQLDSIQKNGNLRNFKRYVRFTKRKGFDNKAIPGRYVLKKGMNYKTVVATFGMGMQTPVNVTFNNVRTRERLAGAVSKYIEADSLSFMTALTDSSLMAGYGFTDQEFIGMFIPNTYEFYWNTDAEGFIVRMKKEYDRFWNASRIAKLEKTGLTRNEVITMASIVAEETRMTDEMPRIAGVYVNRINKKMLLQADPTVKFAVGDFGLRRILNEHLKIDSPYNTYKNLGLPPGPICAPPIRAIDAVLDYEEHNYLFFCAKDDFSGYHSFATSYAQHLKNARAYHKALNDRGIQ